MNKECVNETDKREISTTIYVLKFLAIICVAAAHCGSFVFPVAEKIRALIATLGVPIFLMSSGYYFNPKEARGVFWKKKLKKIVVPLILWGSVTYLIISLRGHTAIRVESWLRWILGYNTWLYFVPVLLSCFLVFRLVKVDWWIIANIVICLFSWILTHIEVIQASDWLTLYQNPFNFSAFFAIGILLKRVDLKKIADCAMVHKLAVFAGTIAVGVCYVYTGNIGYWGNWLSIPFELLASVSLFFAAYAFRNIIQFQNIGKRTFFIFFVHMTLGNGIVNILSSLLHLPNSFGIIDCAAVLFKPLLVIVISYGLYLTVRFTAKKLKFERVLWMIGA